MLQVSACNALVCTVLFFSLLFISYIVFFSAEFGYRCPAACAQASLNFAGAPITSPATGASETDVSHVVFAIAGSARTWEKRQGYTQVWWRPNVTRGNVWLDEDPPGGPTSWPSTCPFYRISRNLTGRLASSAAARIARITADAVAATDASARYVMGDDDTVFIVENLVAVLGKYDHQGMWYIGAPSESVEQDEMHSYAMAFGGGGFALSQPAAAALAERIEGGCLEKYDYFYGSDQRVQACLAELGVPLTKEPGFHQVDLRGDIYGLLAAHPVAPLVSLHHLDYVEPISPRWPTQLLALSSLVSASTLDPARIVQQTFCYAHPFELNWTVSVSWGYTAQIYPYILHPHDLDFPLRTFKTWRSRGDGPFTFNTRPLLPEGSCERPMFFFLSRAWEEKDGSTVTEYSRHWQGKSHKCNQLGHRAASRVQTVRVFAPKLHPEIWKMAPRRQCCEASKTWWGTTTEVRIRSCGPGESTSPP